MKILSWNVKGIDDPSKRHRVGDIIYSEKPDWVGIQETKLREVSVPIISHLFRF